MLLSHPTMDLWTPTFWPHSQSFPSLLEIFHPAHVAVMWQEVAYNLLLIKEDTWAEHDGGQHEETWKLGLFPPACSAFHFVNISVERYDFFCTNIFLTASWQRPHKRQHGCRGFSEQKHVSKWKMKVLYPHISARFLKNCLFHEACSWLGVICCICEACAEYPLQCWLVPI